MANFLKSSVPSTIKVINKKQFAKKHLSPDTLFSFFIYCLSDIVDFAAPEYTIKSSSILLLFSTSLLSAISKNHSSPDTLFSFFIYCLSDIVDFTAPEYTIKSSSLLSAISNPSSAKKHGDVSSVWVKFE